MPRRLLWKIVFATSLIFGTHAWATVIIQVDSAVDEADDDVTDGVCHTASGHCTLRAAIMTANRETFATQINVPQGTYILTIPSSATDDDGAGALKLTASPAGTSPEIDVVGAGAGTTIVDGGRISNVFRIESNRQAYFYKLTIRNGALPESSGGGIANEGLLTLTDVAVSGNTALAGAGISNLGQLYLVSSMVTANVATNLGGGIENVGFLLLQNTTVANNASGFEGGGIATFSGGQIDIEDSTIASNTAVTEGGGMWNAGAASILRSTISNNSSGDGGGISNAGDLVMINSTVADNAALNDGGGIRFDMVGQSNLYNSTIAYNAANSDGDQNGTGGGIFVGAASSGPITTNVYNTLIAGNTVQASPEPNDCRGTGVLYTHANNLFGDSSGCPIVQVSGVYGSLNSLSYLGPLAQNGGYT